MAPQILDARRLGAFLKKDEGHFLEEVFGQVGVPDDGEEIGMEDPPVSKDLPYERIGRSHAVHRPICQRRGE
jgi:hypothetical protein